MPWDWSAVLGLLDEYPTQPGLQTSGMLTRDQVLQFFERCRRMLDQPSAHEYLRSVHAQGQDVEDSITEMQEKIFVEMGVAGSFGLSCLPRISTAFAQDQEVMQVLTRFAAREEEAVHLAQMPHDAWLHQQQLRRAITAHQEAVAQQLQQLPPEERKAFMQQQEQAALAQAAASHDSSSSMSAAETEQFLRLLQGQQPR